MRLNDLSGGSIKVLLILGLLIANIAVALSHRGPDLSKPLTAGARSEMLRAINETGAMPPLPRN